MGKTVRAIMRMQATIGDYPVPTSEAAYLTHSNLIDTATPYGGTLQADGTWAQAPCLDRPFARALPSWARQAGQQYAPFLDPGHGTDGSAIRAVLDDTALQQKAAEGAIALALARFDAPWDGMLYDALGAALGDASYHDKQHDFMGRLSDAAHRAGLAFAVAFRGIRPEDESWSSVKLDRIVGVADIFDYYFYAWWLAPCSTGPYWWNRAGLDNALEHGIRPESIYLGIGNYARYWSAGYKTSQDMTHDQAMQIASASGAAVNWVEDHPTGLIREKYAAVNDGHLWIQDGDTVKPRLALVDEYGLGGVMLFIAGMGAESVWDAIAEWKTPATPDVPEVRASNPTDFFLEVPIGAGELA